jgi:nitroreductase
MSSPLGTDAGIRRMLAAAGQAPSVLNTQPWRFRVVRGEFAELIADYDRRLRVIDPRGRSLHVSCGAALFNLRLAALVSGYRPLVWLLPDPDDQPAILAVLRTAETATTSVRARAMYDDIPARRTNREPYSGKRVPPAVLAELRAAAAPEGASLVPLGRNSSAELREHVAIADEELAKDHDYLAEIAAWTAGPCRYDGMPSAVLGPRPQNDPAPIRDFGVARPGRSRPTAEFEQWPQLAVLTPLGDGPLDWLRAGQALERVLLTASLLGVSVSFLNQPLDLRDMRGRTDPRHRRGHAQMILRLGYGPAVPRAPRRPPAELLRQPDDDEVAAAM